MTGSSRAHTNPCEGRPLEKRSTSERETRTTECDVDSRIERSVFLEADEPCFHSHSVSALRIKGVAARPFHAVVTRDESALEVKRRITSSPVDASSNLVLHQDPPIDPVNAGYKRTLGGRKPLDASKRGTD